MFQHDIKVTIGDQALEVDVWEQYDIVLDLWRPGSPFAFSVPRAIQSESAWRRVRENLKFGAFVKLAIDDSVQFTGRVEDIAGGHDRGKGSVLTFSGRDLAGPAIDWDAYPGARLRSLTLGDALTVLFTPLNLRVLIGADADATRRVQIGTSRTTRTITHRTPRNHVDRARPKPGERIWQVAERLCARFGYMIWIAPDADGGMSVVVGVPKYSSPTIFEFKNELRNGVATPDSNILTITDHASCRDVPTEVNVYPNQAMGAVGPGRTAATLINTWFDDPRHMGGWQTDTTMAHPRHIRMEEGRTESAAMRQAQRTTSHANAKSRNVRLSTEGHAQGTRTNRMHYAFNAMAHVRDDELELDEDMLIERVHFMGARGIGSKTEITLHSKGAIVLEPEDETA